MNKTDAFDYLTKGCIDVVTAEGLKAKLARALAKLRRFSRKLFRKPRKKG